MAQTIDFRKTDKELFMAKTANPTVLKVPVLPYVRVSGEGNPNGPVFAQACAALYGFSYALRMSGKSGDAPAGFVEYKVGTLEGFWALARGDVFDRNKKEDLAWTIQIRQPDFLDRKSFAYFRDKARSKAEKKDGGNGFFDSLEFGRWSDGLCAQILHIGSYDDEPATFDSMERWLEAHGYRRISKAHREIYLSVPGRTAPGGLKTILRVQIEKK